MLDIRAATVVMLGLLVSAPTWAQPASNPHGSHGGGTAQAPAATAAPAPVPTAPAAATQQRATEPAQSTAPRVRPRIVGGDETTIDRHPFQVAISRPGRTTIWCGGSLVRDRWVLTAAHCFYSKQNLRIADDQFVIKLGVSDIGSEGTWEAIGKVFIHENYKPTADNDDIALIRLTRPAPASRIVALASTSTLDQVARRRSPVVATVTGWGDVAEKGLPSNRLRAADLPIVLNSACQTAMQAIDPKLVIEPSMVCAGTPNGDVDSCQGDSGGPLVVDDGSGAVQVGIVSFGYGCARKLRYGVYTRVSSYRSWLVNTIRANP